MAFLIGSARSRVRQLTGARAAALDLTPTQLWMIVGLAEGGAMPLGALGASIFVDAPTASRVIETLAKRGLVACACDQKDRRRTLVTLTPAGERLAADAVRVAEEIRSATVAALDADEEARLRALLEKVIGSLGRG